MALGKNVAKKSIKPKDESAQSIKFFVLAYRVYGDFDMPYDTPKMVSANRSMLNERAAQLNSEREPDEKCKESKWIVLDEQVKLLD